MKLVSEQVYHAKYGVGIVINQTDDVVEVKFGNGFGNKKFVYPVAFESFLKVSNPISQETMNDELRQIQENIEIQRGLRRDAEQRIIEDARRELLAKKRAATKSTATAKSAGMRAAKKAKEKAEQTEKIK